MQSKRIRFGCAWVVSRWFRRQFWQTYLATCRTDQRRLEARRFRRLAWRVVGTHVPVSPGPAGSPYPVRCDGIFRLGFCYSPTEILKYKYKENYSGDSRGNYRRRKEQFNSSFAPLFIITPYKYGFVWWNFMIFSFSRF